MNFMFCNLFFEFSPPNMYYICIMKMKMKITAEKGYKTGPEIFNTDSVLSLNAELFNMTSFRFSVN